jgi:hypothetical protein
VGVEEQDEGREEGDEDEGNELRLGEEGRVSGKEDVLRGDDGGGIDVGHIGWRWFGRDDKRRWREGKGRGDIRNLDFGLGSEEETCWGLILIPGEGRRSSRGREDERVERGVVGVGEDGVDRQGNKEVWDLGGTPVVEEADVPIR